MNSTKEIKLKKLLLSIEESFDPLDGKAESYISSLYKIMVESFKLRNNKDKNRNLLIKEVNRMSESIYLNCVCSMVHDLNLLKNVQLQMIEYAKLTNNYAMMAEYITCVDLYDGRAILKIAYANKNDSIWAEKIVEFLILNNEKFQSLSMMA